MAYFVENKIIKSVNSNDDIVEALKYALEFINTGCSKFDKMHTITKIEQALLKAGSN